MKYHLCVLAPVCLALQVVTAQSLITEDPAATEVAVAADLVIKGNNDATTAALEVEGDAVVQGDHYVDGDLVIDGNRLNPNAYLKRGYISPRSGFLGNDIYSADTDNFLFLADRRFTVTQEGFTDPRIYELFDGEFDSNNQWNRIFPDQSATINLDLISKKELSRHGLTYPEGYIYVTFYYNAVASGLSGRSWDRNGVERALTVAKDVYGNGRLWRLSIPRNNYITRFELTIDGPASDSNIAYAAVEEIEYHLHRPTNRTRRPHVSKYTNEKLYKNFNFKDANNETTIQLLPDTGKIVAKELVVSGSLKTAQGGSFVLGNSATTASGAIRWSGSDFEGYKGKDDGWVSLTKAPEGNVNVFGEFQIDNTPDETTDLPLAATQPGAFTVQGGSVRQGSESSRTGAIFRMGSMEIGATQRETAASSFQWFTEVDFTDSGQQLVYIYLGEFPFQMWGYFDITVTSDYWSPSVGRGAITKRFPIAYNVWNAKSPGNFHKMNEESSAVIAAAGGIVDFVTIGEAELHGTQFRVPIYFKAGGHATGGISVSGIFTRNYNVDGYPYAEIESYEETIALDNAVKIHELKVDGDISVLGSVSMAEAQGDISMGRFTAN